MKKVAVVLFNLGGPDSLTAIEEFLFNLFYDKYIIRLPKLFRFILAKTISKLRKKKAEKLYTVMGGASPILAETKLQQEALENALGKNYKVFICMRYSEPRAQTIVKQIEEYQPDEILLLPLYPQYSSTTTKSSYEEFIELVPEMKEKTKLLCCYYGDENFINAHVDNISSVLKEIKGDNIRILFSAHSLPKSIIDGGDPYQFQIEQTVIKIMEKLGDIDYRICYQSKVGLKKWLEPTTEEEIIKASIEQKQIIVVPIAFVSEHSETLVELDIDYRRLATKNNAPGYFRVQALRDNKLFIESLKNLILELSLKEKNGIFSFKEERICNNQYCECLNVR